MPSINTIRGGFSGIGGFVGGQFVEQEYLGSTMIFAQATAPFGWTKVTTYNDCAIRITSGTPTSGGTRTASSVFSNYNIYNPVTITGAALQATTLSTPQIAPHTHPVNIQPVTGSAYPGGAQATRSVLYTGINQSVGGGYAPTVPSTPTNPAVPSGHVHTLSLSVSVSSPFNFAVKYVDVVLAKYY